ncbi:hypothetical protein HK405_006010, partial [Cladochytrium tenue]
MASPYRDGSGDDVRAAASAIDGDNDRDGGSPLPLLITFEEHYLSSAVAPPASLLARPGSTALVAALRDAGPARLAAMDSGRVTIQLLSHTYGFGAASPEACAAINDDLAAVARAHPRRFAVLACLPMADPPAAAAELRRAVEVLGCRGALVDNHAAGAHYDGPAYDAVWATACDLDVPV